MTPGEFDLVEVLRRTFGPAPGHVALGIGDDAAVLDDGLVLSVDAQVEHVHFERAWLSDEAIGYRSFVAALSDLAAMGADAVAALSSLVLADAAQAEAIARGQAAAAREYGCPVVGGNLSRGPSLAITTTVLGRSAAPLGRAGARPGDGVFVAGRLGAAAAGLAAYQAGHAARSVQDAWARPVARIAEGKLARGWATAAIDLSDGLGQDAAHLARASDVAIDFDRAALSSFVQALSAEAALLGVDPWRWVLGGGEDYALLVTGAGAPGFVRIGSVLSGAGVRLGGAPLRAAGHDHFG